MNDDAYSRALRALFARTNQGIKLGLETMQALLNALGRPDRGLRHVVVGGTNGKGSTSTLIAAGLRAAGHRVGHYTSPHLLRFTERIRIGELELNRDEVVKLLTRVMAVEAVCPRSPTFFEVVTAMALLAFAEAGVDVAVLEVGMGGRLDATNAVTKLLSVITPVDLDHMHFLGNTRAAIAFEKAGIIPHQGVVVLARQHDEARQVLLRVASERGARVVEAATGRRVGATLELCLAPPLTLREWPPGAYQRENLATAATALRELDALGVACPDEAIAYAAATFRWPGRYDWLGGDPPLLADGAHNPAGVLALIAALDEDPRVAGRPVHIVATVLNDRPAPEMLAPLASRARSLHLTPVPSGRSRTSAELASLWPSALVYPALSAALADAREHARTDGGVVVACGSLFLVGELLALEKGEQRDPPVDA